MEVGESAIPLRQVRIPDPDDHVEGELAEEHAVHPAEGELDQVEAFLGKVFHQFGLGSGQQFLHTADLAEYTGLARGIVVLDTIHELAEAPETIGFDYFKDFTGERCVTDVFGQEDIVKRSY